MVKFGKNLEVQLVPEWCEAYVCYKRLKKELNKICKAETLPARGSIFSSVRQNPSVKLNSPRAEGHGQMTPGGCGSLRQIRKGGMVSSGSEVRLRKQGLPPTFIELHVLRGCEAEGADELFHTSLLSPLNERAGEATFFSYLDAQLNKVNSFYSQKEREFLARFKQLEGQVAALERLKAFQTEPASAEQLRLELPPATPLLTVQSMIRRLQEDLGKRRSSSGDSTEDESEGAQKVAPASATAAAPASRTSDPGGRAIRSAERMLKDALREFYRGLGLLRDYRALNLVAFHKILKKHDKRMGCSTAPTFLDAVRRAHFHVSPDVSNMMAATEALYAQRFAHNCRRAAMQELRPPHRSASHAVTFKLGFLSGLLLALVVTFAVMLAVAGGYDRVGGPGYIQAVFPLFCGPILLLVHMFAYGLDTYCWRRTNINYGFIFDLRPQSEMRFREVLLATTFMAVVTLGGMVLHLVVAQSGSGGFSRGDFIPLFVWLIWLAVAICPFNLFWRSTRQKLGRVLMRLAAAPLYRVALADFFVGDQLTSQIPFLQFLMYTVYYFAGGHFRARDGAGCAAAPTYRRMLYVLAILPYWFRFAQCWRRYLEEGRNAAHVYNAGKYLSALVAITFRLWHRESQNQGVFVLGILTAVVATIYLSYWDIVVDWGLFRRHARRPWLRDQLVLGREWIYFAAAFFNVLLRLAWIQSIFRFQISPEVPANVLILVVAALEVIRRGIWNFFRIENEHLNNVGTFRALRSVPLPFQEKGEPGERETPCDREPDSEVV